MATFQLIDLAGAPPPAGPWQARPAEAASFGAGAADDDGPLWLVDLPASRPAALAALAAAEADLRRHAAAIEGAPARIGALAATAGAASFAAGRLPAPERQLLAMLDELGGPAGAPAAAFSTRSAEPPAWAEAAERFQAFAAQVQRAVATYAVVETRVDGLLVARSSVGWTGDLRSLLGATALTGQAGLHRRSLALALGSRAALLKTFGTVMRGAAIVALMAGSPAGAVMALPAAWKFVEQLLSELREPPSI